MKQISLHILAVAAASLALTACEKDNIEPDGCDVAAVFTATIQGAQSRVIGTEWEPGDEIGITSTTCSAYNVCYTTQNTNGEFALKDDEEQIYYNGSRTTKITFNAYYPYKYIANPSTTTNKYIEVNTSDQANQKSFDYLFASGQGSKDSPTVNLEFSHKMSMVTLIFKNGVDFNVSDISRCRLGKLSITGNFNIQSGTFEQNSLKDRNVVEVDLSDIDVKEEEPVTPFILIPQTLTTPFTLEIESSNRLTYTVDLTFPSNRLVAGNNYEFTITVNNTGMTVNNCTIENWTSKEDSGWGNGIANSADDPEDGLEK